jgi:Holliday junction resolvasome RuvABC ATP-dependent DNA helicase subunit
MQDNLPALNDSFDMLPGVPEAVSVANTAYILGVSKQTIERMIQSGILNKTPEGEVAKADLIQYISSHALADLPVL